ncbi:MAG: NADH:ubiquinone oxidoreductase subunit J [Legionellales bacterium]|nr:NADH:ubiquinone oxidoreductase subunit J [Legionellales bacterium]|tara:strand:- start:233 stop:832 length:600 start_codon:yes stop_codon:yes gene_type:complete
MTQIIFYIFGSILLLSATLVVVIKNPIHAALFLVLSFFSSAAIWLLLNAEFLAIALVLVYVGAVMVLFLFVVMMLDINISTLREGFARYFPLGIIIALFMMVAMSLVVGSDYFLSDIYTQANISSTQSNTKLLGLTIYQDYLYHFEIAGVILLVAIIAAISLSMNKTKITKSTHPDEQVLAKKNDRLRIVKMNSEEKES